jgi:hypothetical protein
VVIINNLSDEENMHDINRIQPEFGSGPFGSQQYEGGLEMWGETDAESPFSEAQEMELANELLGVTTEVELNQFLGNLIGQGVRAVGGLIKSSTGQALGGLLKGAARQGLPMLGRVVGTYFGGPAEGVIGGNLASRAGRMFGLELEGLSQEEREFETARQFVRFGGAAAKRASLAPRTANPRQVARAAMIHAARRHAPGLLRKKRPRRYYPGTQTPIRQPFYPDQSPDVVSGTPVHHGRWIRRGPGIVILNCYGTSPSTQPSSVEPSMNQSSPQGGEGDEGMEGF